MMLDLNETPVTNEAFSSGPTFGEEPGSMEGTPIHAASKRATHFDSTEVSSEAAQAFGLTLARDIRGQSKPITHARSEPFEYEESRTIYLSFDELTSTDRVTDETEVARANKDRIALLARRYVQKRPSTEEDARLQIVTERMRRLVPRVSADDFEELENIIREIKEIGDADDRLRKKLRLK